MHKDRKDMQRRGNRWVVKGDRGERSDNIFKVLGCLVGEWRVSKIVGHCRLWRRKQSREGWSFLTRTFFSNVGSSLEKEAHMSVEGRGRRVQKGSNEERLCTGDYSVLIKNTRTPEPTGWITWMWWPKAAIRRQWGPRHRLAARGLPASLTRSWCSQEDREERAVTRLNLSVDTECVTKHGLCHFFPIIFPL